MINTDTIVIDDPDTLVQVCGPNDRNLKQLEGLLHTRIYTRGNEIHLAPENSEHSSLFESILNDLLFSVKQKKTPNSYMIETLFQYYTGENPLSDGKEFLTHEINIPGGKGRIIPRNLNQARFISLMENHDLSIGVGPAGTGKTFLAIAYALSEILNRRYRKLILTRPVVEAGETLGYLPGDLTQKLDPYLKPLFDAMEEILTTAAFQKIQDMKLYEISPLAYMRGRSLKNCIIVLDEAQNTTQEQMKMFLTRMGEGSRAIVTGDLTQIDLPCKEKSGLIHAAGILKNVDGIGFSSFQRGDVVRHPLVKKILEAYEQEHTN
ncbi:PhoH family protein [Oceanispirochaeta sp.]|uniref:PhoH family protein n=1 Tax=Oceanispirochaeta sp. TaxID=2035350 RepID=UPI0026080142|nr:PhoH family protein [Oceanispirochaeta sp.]MDA3955541.1 PhoH family protein [Oceanispirochaeta sp.]